MLDLLRSLLILIVLCTVAACEPPGALVLPEGDAEHGQELFVNFQCNACHSVRGLELPESDIEREYELPIGGRRVKTYPELVTSVPPNRF